jgi:hypothetical protein
MWSYMSLSLLYARAVRCVFDVRILYDEITILFGIRDESRSLAAAAFSILLPEPLLDNGAFLCLLLLVDGATSEAC